MQNGEKNFLKNFSRSVGAASPFTFITLLLPRFVQMVRLVLDP